MYPIKPGTIIKHRNFMDVCIRVTTSFDYGHGYRLKGMWINLGFVNSYPIGYDISLNIAKDPKDIGNHRRTSLDQYLFLDPACINDSCYRNSQWRPFVDSKPEQL